MKPGINRLESERMSDLSFRLMNFIFSVVDFFYHYIDKRIQTFGIRDGMAIVDYGCGPGRYTTRFARLVGEKGKVYAVDIQELAILNVRAKITRMELANVETVLVRGY
jgi:ubiquinone/menaquinone biosynthesis C-methylase UbiE